MAISVSHYSDILCIWAYVSEIRMQELQAKFGADIVLDYRTLAIFGNVPGKIESGWAAKGGLADYARHVQEVAENFEHVRLHPRVWLDNTPQSSLPAHLRLAAVRVAERNGIAVAGSWLQLASRLRQAFFTEAQDISSAAVLTAILREVALPVADIEALIADGRAWAALSEDMQLAKEQDVRSSPTLLFNDGRQRLAGNVGYRIIEANIRELIERPAAQHSWC